MTEPLKLTEEVTTTRTIFATPDDLGEIFSEMEARDQVAALRAMVEYMNRWPKQWDAVAIELANNSELRNDIRTYLGL